MSRQGTTDPQLKAFFDTKDLEMWKSHCSNKIHLGDENLRPRLLSNSIHTERSLSSDVIPLRVRWRGILQNGASRMTGSKKKPTARERGQSCSILPPEITPGTRRTDVPLYRAQ